MDNHEDVAYALVETLRAEEFVSGDEGLLASNAVYQYLSRQVWNPDDFDERGDLLRLCADTGWRMVGISLAEINQNRRNPGGNRLFSTDIPHPRGNLRRDTFPNGGTHLAAFPEAAQDASAVAAYSRACARLLAQMNRRPALVADEAPRLHAWLSSFSLPFGLFDERRYFLGVTAELAAGSLRHLGRYDEAESWLLLAADEFVHATEPQSLLVRLECDHLGILYDKREYSRVATLARKVERRLSELGMERDRVKCLLIEGLSLRQLGDTKECLERLVAVAENSSEGVGPAYRALAWATIADVITWQGNASGAEVLYRKAWSFVRTEDEPLVRGTLLVHIGQFHRLQGEMEAATFAYRRAVTHFSSLGMQTWAAYARTLLAETLMASGQYPEAEEQVRMALPTIESGRLLPEGLAVGALLRQSIEERRLHPEALTCLRGKLDELSRWPSG